MDRTCDTIGDIMDHEAQQLAAVRALSAEARRDLETHPSSDEILDYHRQALSAGPAESLRDHLAICPDCARRALDLAALSQPELFLEDGEPPAETAAAQWRAVRDRLDQEGLLTAGAARSGEPERSVVTAFPGVKHNLFGSVLFAYATAALFFLVSLVTSAWLFLELRRAAGPRAGPQLVDLQPVEVIQRDGAVAPAPPIDGRADSVLILSVSSVDPARLDLGPDGRPAGGGYRAEIVDLRHPQRPVVWSHDHLELTENICTIGLPGRALAAGAYGIRLYTAGGESLAEYRCEVEGP